MDGKLTPLVIRADAGSQMGMGHIMRCLALAQAWQISGGRAVFLSRAPNEAILERIGVEGIEFRSLTSAHPHPSDLSNTLNLLGDLQASWLVLDGYHFDPEYQKQIRAAGYRLLVMDDMAHLPAYHADILLNQNLGAEKLKYNCDPDTILLLGPRYALLRQEFLAWRDRKRQTAKVARKVLVTMGGSDPDNVTLKVIQALEQVELEGLEAIIVVGGSNPHYATLRSVVRLLKPKIRLERNVSNMPELMAWADVAVTAGGSTCWELAFMSVPGLVLATAENQLGVVKGLETSGMAVSLGWHQWVTSSQIAQSLVSLLSSTGKRTELAHRCHAQVDGDGVDRVLAKINRDRIRLRYVREEDKVLLWEWANSPEVRAASFSTDSISWEQHVQWFASKQKDPNCVFYLALNEADIPLGYVRYDIDGAEATISISIDEKHRGHGYGSQLITLASQKLCQRLPIRHIHAYIKMTNEASTHAFLKAKFQEDKNVFVHGQPAKHLILNCERIL